MGTCQQNFMLAPYHPWHAGLLLCLFRWAKCRVVSHWIRFVARSSTFLAGNGPVPFQEGRRQKPGICTWKFIYKVYGSILLDEHRCFAAIKAQSSIWKDRWKSTSNEWDSSVANKQKVDRHRSTVFEFSMRFAAVFNAGHEARRPTLRPTRQPLPFCVPTFSIWSCQFI